MTRAMRRKAYKPHPICTLRFQHRANSAWASIDVRSYDNRTQNRTTRRSPARPIHRRSSHIRYSAAPARKSIDIYVSLDAGDARRRGKTNGSRSEQPYAGSCHATQRRRTLSFLLTRSIIPTMQVHTGIDATASQILQSLYRIMQNKRLFCVSVGKHNYTRPIFDC